MTEENSCDNGIWTCKEQEEKLVQKKNWRDGLKFKDKEYIVWVSNKRNSKKLFGNISTHEIFEPFFEILHDNKIQQNGKIRMQWLLVSTEFI